MRACDLEVEHLDGRQTRRDDRLDAVQSLRWALRGVPLALTHRWEGQGLVGSELSTPLPVGADADAWRDALAEATGAGSFVANGRVGVTFPEPARPERVMRLAEPFTLAVTELLGGDVGPYR